MFNPKKSRGKNILVKEYRGIMYRFNSAKSHTLSPPPPPPFVGLGEGGSKEGKSDQWHTILSHTKRTWLAQYCGGGEGTKGTILFLFPISQTQKDAFFPFLRLSIAAFCDANFPLPLPAKRINSFQINTVYFLLGTDKGKGRDWTLLLFFVAAAGGGKKVWQGWLLPSSPPFWPSSARPKFNLNSQKRLFSFSRVKRGQRRRQIALHGRREGGGKKKSGGDLGTKLANIKILALAALSLYEPEIINFWI